MLLNSIFFNLSSETNNLLGTGTRDISGDQPGSFFETLQNISSRQSGQTSQESLSKAVDKEAKNLFKTDTEKEVMEGLGESEKLFLEDISLLLKDFMRLFSQDSLEEKELSEVMTEDNHQGNGFLESIKEVLEKIHSQLENLIGEMKNRVKAAPDTGENIQESFTELESLTELKSVLTEFRASLEGLDAPKDKMIAGVDEKITKEAQNGSVWNEMEGEEPTAGLTRAVQGEEKSERQNNAAQEKIPEEVLTRNLSEENENVLSDKKGAVQKEKNEIAPEQKQTIASLKELSEKADQILERMQNREESRMITEKTQKDSLETELKTGKRAETGLEVSGFKEITIQKMNSETGTVKPLESFNEIEPEVKIKPMESMESKNRDTDADIFHKEGFMKELESSEGSSKEKVASRYQLDNSILEQVTDKMKKHLFLQGKNEITLSLKPEFLGELKMDISIDKNVLKADVSVQNSLTKDILDGSIDKLKQSLESQGLQMEKFSVTVGQDGSKEAYYQEQKKKSFTPFQSGRVETEEDSMPLERYIENGRLDFLI